MLERSTWGRWILAIAGGLAIVYALLVLGFAATSPDLGLRFLLVDEVGTQGPIVRAVLPTMKTRGHYKPQVGDQLIELGGVNPPDGRWMQWGPTTRDESGNRRGLRKIGTLLHFTNGLKRLRGEVRFDGKLPGNSDPAELGDVIPSYVENEADHWLDRDRLVEAVFQSKREGKPERTWLYVQSLPPGELGIPLLWFLLQLGIFTVGAVAFWTRPFDRAARVFFAMCLVTVGAFVGGYHWWVIAGTPWLNVPFAICAVLVPAVTLHFFMVFPYPKGPIASFPRLTLVVLYAPPVIGGITFVTLLSCCTLLYMTDAPVVQLQSTLILLRTCIFTYIVIATLYFAGTLLALTRSFFATRNTLEHQQVAWILWAAAIATVPVGYTFCLAAFDRVGFAIGRGTLPMFSASLLFMMAYAVGIARHKLMLAEQLFSRETLYFVVSALATGTYSLLIAAVTLIAILQHIRSSREALVVAALLMVAVILFGWLRDRVQRLLDRRFYREKYQLDKALQQMNQMAGELLEPSAVAERMLSSCREVLMVGHAALYFLDGEQQQFRLVAVEGQRPVPSQFAASVPLIAALQQTPSLRRSTVGLDETDPVIRRALRDLNADLLQALEVDGVIEGVVLLGEKRLGTEYSAEDLTFLTAMGQVAGVAMHSAKVHQVVGRLNEELQLKVTKISEQQRQITLLQSEISAAHTLVPVKALELTADSAAEDSFQCEQIRGSSPTVVQLLETVRKVANSDASVLIRGESGTGKERLAEAIHQNSSRRQGPLVKVHCGALSPGLLESELFGHVKGAFTGAHRDKAGRFELANGGTLFLDEIGDISLETQIKLLRVLQEREFEPVGATRTVEVDVRLVTATHQNLEKLISEGKFREDLFYRLNVITITPPPLRERGDDIIELAMFFMSRAAERLAKPIHQIEGVALERLRHYSWPGNIRELENSIERAVVLAEGEKILLHDLPPEIVNGSQAWMSSDSKVRKKQAAASATDAAPSSESIADGELRQLRTALEQCGGNKAEAARLLGMPRSTFFSKLKKFALS